MLHRYSTRRVTYLALKDVWAYVVPKYVHRTEQKQVILGKKREELIRMEEAISINPDGVIPCNLLSDS
jgi:hypothetical protein